MTWTRKGECNRCGWCCILEGQHISSFKFTGSEADVEFFKVRGYTIFTDENGKPLGATKLVSIHSPCVEYDEPEKRCRIYDTRPRTCVDFPALPEQVRFTPCSYWFEDENGTKVGGQGSPHPAPIPIFKPV